MLTAGLYHTLRVNRISDFGLYLADEEDNEVLLPNRYVSMEMKEGDEITVFIYHDSEDRLVATTEKPYATVGTVAFLKVVDKTIHGAFLDWGLPAKDLFLPNRNTVGRLEPGKKYVVYLYTDNITGRVVASMNLGSFIKNNELEDIQPRKEVEIILASESPIGYRVVINNKYWGMLYRNQVFRPVKVGDRMNAFIAKITEDNRIDVNLQQQGYDQIKKSADDLENILRSAGGSLPVNDDTDPEEVYRLTEMSKKTFKRAVGYLMKQSRVTMTEKGITLTDSE